ncbi:MAG: BNR-4 repeat-containing protein [Kordia sp.]|uniref:BNR-4 repeat-containing protein n=1 Tax=Kordia sp. TaxID=1965332 RepID=UPI00385B523C
MKPVRYLFFLLYLLGANGLAQNEATHSFTKSKAVSSENYQSMTFNGVWSWFSDPRAVYYEGKYKRTYAGWIDNYGDVHIGFYDHDTKQIASKIIYDNLEIDDHDNPSILFDADGKLLVFFNTHLQDDRPLFMRTSINAEDIDDWSPIRELYLNDTQKYTNPEVNRHTYTNPVRLSKEDGKLYIFWRGIDLKPSFSVSTDNGKTWSKGKIMFSPHSGETLKTPYTKVYSDGVSKIHFTFTDGHPTKEKKNGLYYMYYENGAFYKANGKKIKPISQLPVLQSELDVIFESDTVKSWNWDIAQDTNGDPIVTYTKFPDKNTSIYTYATFTNNQWKSYDLMDAGGWFPKTRKGTKEPEQQYTGGIVIDHETPNTVYLSVKHDSVFEIEQWTTKNNGKSWKAKKITENSTKDNVRPFAIRNAKKGNPLQVLWLQNTKYIYYAHDTRGKGIPLDFKDRFHTAVKMNLEKPRVNAALTKTNLTLLLRKIAERLLENPAYTLAQNDWRYGMFFKGIAAFYEISNEERYRNELLNIQQYQSEESEESEDDLYNLLWSYRTKNDRNALQKLESLRLQDFHGKEASLAFASQMLAIEEYADYIPVIDQLKAFYIKSMDSLLELLQYQYDGKTLKVKAFVIYSVAAAIRNGVFDRKYSDKVFDAWKQLQIELLEENRYQKLDTETSAAILLAGKEIHTLLTPKNQH